MSSRKWKFRVEDMIASITAIQSYAQERTAEELRDDPMRLDAILRRFEILGEAAAQVPQEVRVQHAEIPWPLIRGMRNTLIHQYGTVKADIVWKTIRDDLPPLLPLLQHFLETETE